MSEPIGPGDLVECISVRDDSVSGYTVGSTYIVDEVGVLRGIPWLNCLRMPRPSECESSSAPGWLADAFRPISRRSDFEKVLEQLKAPLPELQDA